MPYAAIEQYVRTTLAGDVAAYLNAKVANFPNIANYYAASGYFGEHTVQAAMLICIDRWITANENPNHVLILSEYPYPNFANIADIALIYNNGGGASNIYIELKADFTPQSVDADINLLDSVASLQNSTLTDGFAFYVYYLANPGWTNHIDNPIEANVYKRGIGV